MDESHIELAQTFADIAQELEKQPSLEATVDEAVRQAVDVVPGCDFAGVSWLQERQPIETIASTDEIATLLDKAQFEHGEGPAVESLWDGDTCLVEDMRADTRWPRFAARAAELGILSMLSCQLPSPRRTSAALNLYAREAGALDEDSVAIVQVFAAHASIALTHRRTETGLRAAIDTRGTIGQAIGILVERHKMPPERAFDLLVRASQRSHVKLRDLAGYVVDTGVEPDAAASMTTS
ncbi:MAG TPA: GAF and ANTAR domain-containing protein [Jatrophihabitantaceae bacterium]|jgi:transcriptional regulator with GAF, ATPase, and Fis domain|nr:GAF and ANTAR domain-containing protein [Jatrophihabitantaceae bacterium]